MIIELDKISKQFPDQKKMALDSISFSICEKECVIVSGANGSGKSVLMNIIAGLDQASSGSVRIHKKGANTRVGLVFQDADSQILADTVEEDVAWGPINQGFSRKEAKKISQESLFRCGLTGKEKLPAHSLSGGEKRRLAVAGILAMNATIIIFDEPFANLDWPGVVQVNDIIESLKEEGKTIIILTHELEKVLALATRILILFEGALVFDGLPEKALSQLDLEKWGVRNPFGTYSKIDDLIWKKTKEMFEK